MGHAARSRAAGTRQPDPADQAQVPVLGPELGLAAGADHRIDHFRWWLQRSWAWSIRAFAESWAGHRQHASGDRRVSEAADERYALRERAGRSTGGDLGHERANQRT